MNNVSNKQALCISCMLSQNYVFRVAAPISMLVPAGLSPAVSSAAHKSSENGKLKETSRYRRVGSFGLVAAF